MNSSFFDVDSGDVSRSGRVRKRSSKLADYDPTDDLDVKPSRKERRDSGQYSKRKTKVMVTPTAPDMKAEPHDDLGSEDELQGYEVDGYDTSGGAAAYDGGVPYETGDTSYGTAADGSYDPAAVGVADNVEVKTESDEDDDFSNLIMVANDDDEEGFNDDDAEGDGDPDRGQLSDEDQDPLVIDEAPARGSASRRGKGAKMATKQAQRGKPGPRPKNVSKMWRQQRMIRKDKGQPRISAYLLWAREVRDFVAQANPDMDFSQINKRLGAMWNTLPDAKKYNFKRRAQRINGRHNVLEASGSSAKMKSTGKGPKGRPSKKALEGAAEAATSEMGGKHPSMPPPSMSEATSLVNPTNYRVCTTQPIDLAAHMVLLGESLGVIGQKLRDHDGQIAVSGSLSVLLDSLLCALVPLVALTKQVPELDGCDDRDLIKTLDNIAYFMPGL
ncbi:uncharacterized protein LOC122384941 [Amphibalanus amphitrite]|uniref:uncharacterized protein LOC122383296 n=1 Tax=Amphibalanus amphitrite TaxID=1232801 RepID=UPI001C91F622|nr:uncharacterized protein LOC122383296 [Amphibalanus amphitrite]XP_043225516.1 uncharacterized protein LOC122383296 [Amphibalanus amphitrite]XP_043225517.1 uncharacterized protein LOC122383296 [Amphibalanus amphitrite]XP_043228722.1 uncharacterized protein LOC122384941 [Amphibalanus amphitrite]XP_043228723.1 uncharacterized protein LOC122384941 [Amphibalanus amphitrite]XP_043228724.1 uncharacterized protein LOC122384941 [Amphibalanus amphitrite]